jgi:succinoglycan biosynthesis protein ExoA
VQSALDQDYPSDRLEIIVVVADDGDDTGRILERVAASDTRVRAVPNPSGRTPTAMNIGIRAARGDVVVRVDAHGTVERGYVAAGVEALERTQAAAVGGVAEFVSSRDARIAEAIAIAMGSKLGAGTAAFRTADAETEADTIMWGVYPRELFERVGYFDEELIRNQDDELCHRIRLHGGKLVITPAMRFQHAARGTLGGLWRQYYEWGSFRVATLAKHGRPGAPRQMIPVAIVVALGTGTLTLVATRGRSRLGWLLTGSYAAAVAVAGTITAAERRRPGLSAHVAAAIATMQTAYGCGFAIALGRRLAPRRPGPRRVASRQANSTPLDDSSDFDQPRTHKT